MRFTWQALFQAVPPAWAGRWNHYATRLRTFLRGGSGGRSGARPLSAPSDGRAARSCRLAIIVPFRDSQHPGSLSQGEERATQLAQFVEHMATFLAGIDHHIFVIEQSQDDLPFNKGYLMNVGFNLAAPEFDYFAFHDVDQLPTNPRNDYSFPASPIHLCVTTDGRTQYRGMVGGVLLINKDDFVACNGWSNRYLGWGQEDDDMAARLRNSTGFRRAAADVGTYRSIGHARVHGLDETFQFQRNRRYLEQSVPRINARDGYRDASFEILSETRMSEACTRHVVAIAGPSPRFGFHCYAKTTDAAGDILLLEHATVRSQIVSLSNCVVDRTHVQLTAGGGEMPADAIPEEQEFAAFARGALQLRHPGGLDPARLGGYQRQLLASAEPIRSAGDRGEESVTTFVVERREYVNLYHTLIELFNAYVAIQLLAGGESFNLLLLDGHCRGSLDSLWSDILKPARIYRLHEYSRAATWFRKLVLVPGGYDSPLYNTGPLQPSRFEDFLSDFIAAVLAAYEVGDQPTDGLALTFVDRRDYKPHPRSDGIVCRKVENLAATTDLLRRLYPDHRIDVHGFEEMPFGQQLRIVRNSAVLCGVHGAALTHVLFMRPGSELVEFTPRAYRRNDIFKYLAGYKGVRYRRYFADTKHELPGGKLVVEPVDRSLA